MVEPYDSDVEVRGDTGQIGRPLVEQLDQEAARIDRGRLQMEHHKRDEIARTPSLKASARPVSERGTSSYRRRATSISSLSCSAVTDTIPVPDRSPGRPRRLDCGSRTGCQSGPCLRVAVHHHRALPTAQCEGLRTRKNEITV